MEIQSALRKLNVVFSAEENSAVLWDGEKTLRSILEGICRKRGLSLDDLVVTDSQSHQNLDLEQKLSVLACTSINVEDKREERALEIFMKDFVATLDKLLLDASGYEISISFEEDPKMEKLTIPISPNLNTRCGSSPRTHLKSVHRLERYHSHRIIEIPSSLDLYVITTNKDLLQDFQGIISEMDLQHIFLLSIDLWNFKSMYHYPPEKIVERSQRIVTKWFDHLDQSLISRHFSQSDELINLKKNINNVNKVGIKIFDGIWMTVKNILQKAYVVLQEKFSRYKFVPENPHVPREAPTNFSTELFENITFMEIFCEFVKSRGHIQWLELLVVLTNFEKKIWLMESKLNTAARTIYAEWFKGASKVEWTDEQKKIIYNLTLIHENNFYTRTSFSDIAKNLISMFDQIHKEFIEFNYIKSFSPSSLDRAKKTIEKNYKIWSSRKESYKFWGYIHACIGKIEVSEQDDETTGTTTT